MKNGIIEEIDRISEQRRREILDSEDALIASQKVYYVSCDGCDENDGLSMEKPWKSLERVSSAELLPGDLVLFKRGDLFRGFVKAKSGVTYGAYGTGDKPKFYGWCKDLAQKGLWELFNAEKCIWRLKEPILDCGTLVFDHGAAHSRKLIPSYINGKFVTRDDESREFDMTLEMTRDLDIVCFYDKNLTTKPTKGEDFPIPVMDENSLGELYLRCDKGDPADVFESIEALTRRHMFKVGSSKDVRIDNLCIKYVGTHAISAGGTCVSGLHVSNCEIGWIGGAIQHYYGTDPNFPKGRRGTVTRFGNGVEIYGGCDGYTVENCYIYQVYDAGITHQVSTFGKTFEMKNINYLDNLVEYCVYGIEYFLEKTEHPNESFISDCRIEGNIIRLSGYGWGQQRHNTDTPALIKGWSYDNTAKSFIIRRNVFDRCAYRMLHLVAKDKESLPKMSENTYVQKQGLLIGQYGENHETEPLMLVFDQNAEESIKNILKDTDAKIYFDERN